MNISIILQFGTGIGHLARVSAIANELRKFAEVTVFSGGRSVDFRFDDAIRFVQLPAMYWEPAVPGAILKPVDPAWSSEECQKERSRILVQDYRNSRPAIVLTEYFPFSPGRFGSTLDDLLEEIRISTPRPLLFSSIRSLPQLTNINPQVSPEWIRKILLEDYDGVIHHADPSIFPITSLGAYFVSALSEIPVYQTGFVRKPLPLKSNEQPKGILLTVGGGNAKAALLMKKWLDAVEYISPELYPVHAVCGPLMPLESKTLLREVKSPEVIIHESVSDLDELMQKCCAVVCMGGYNTLIEALSLQKPVLSFASGMHEDQHFQIERFAERGLLVKGDPDWSPEEIASAIESVVSFSPSGRIIFDGAEKTAKFIFDSWCLSG